MCFKHTLILILILTEYLTLTSQQESYFFHRLTVADNLSSQNLNYYIHKDINGFVWISSSEGLNRFDGREIKQYQSDKADSTSLANNASIFSPFFNDKKGNIWFSTQDMLQVYNHDKDNFHRLIIRFDGKKINGDYYLMKLNEPDDEFWLEVNDSLFVSSESDFNRPHFVGKYLFQFNSTLIHVQEQHYLLTPLEFGIEIRKFRGYSETNLPDTILKKYSISTPSLINNNQLYFGSDQGLIQYDLGSHQENLFNEFDGEEIINVSAIEILDSTFFIIGTQNQGLFYFNTQANKFTDQIYQFDGLVTKPFIQPIDKIFIDEDKIIWISTSGRGVFFTKLGNKKFTALLQNKEGEPIDNNFIRSITEDTLGQIWCLSRNGISIIDKTGQYLDNSHKNQGENVPFSQSYPYYIFCDKANTTWVCDETGLYYLTSKKTEFKKAFFEKKVGKSNLFFTNLYQLENEKILCASSAGIYCWNEPLSKLERISGLEYENETFSWIEENSKTKQVLFRVAQKKILIGHFQQEQFHLDTTILFKPFIQFIYKDESESMYWLATSEGLFWLEYKGKNYKLQQDSILPFNSIIGVLKEDKSDNLWLSTNKGIIRYNPKLGKWKNFTLSDGLQAQEFNFFASHKTKSGKMIFGGVNGINIFDPKEINDNLTPVNPTITSILINDVEPKEKLKCSITGVQNVSLIEKLDFDIDKNTLSFHFAALDYVNPDANQFKYRMIGIEKDWVPPKTENFARYPNLSPGNYTFEVDATNSDGIWSENPAQLRITIHPPWYQTKLAYGTFALFTLLIFYSIYRFQLNRRLVEAEAHRLKELDRIKTALYTNITHEFRTPLTIILGMAEQIEEKPKKGFYEGIEMIRRSGQNLLNLVNQILDLAKIESGNMQARYVQGDIVQFLQYLVESFHSFAASKNINVVFYNEMTSLVMDYDADKLQTILINLLSNATKFTPEKGKIIVHVQQITATDKNAVTFCQLKIKDNGIGMEEKDLPHIFDRFYQIDDTTTRHSGGTGIGLALTKELVELLDGSISVQSQLNKGTEFTILLPVRRTASFTKDFNKENLAEKISLSIESNLAIKETELVEANDQLPLVLIIEDNLDVITYLQACLEDTYRVTIALNGQVGIEKALELIPDIIITDIMMPLKDGYEVCEVLKKEERTSHIPIIMLTAKAQIEAKIEGLSKGADAYLSKPFHQKELNVRLEQLLIQRKRLQEHYSKASISESPPPIVDPFIQKVTELIEANLAADFNLETFCQTLAMSRSQVYRKIKAMTGHSTTIFIRRIRLKNAHRLLKTSKLSISEVAYEVGFSSPAFFSTCFLEVYKQTPSQVKEGI